MRQSHRISVHPEVMAGKPVIKGTRVPVDLIIKKMAQTMDADDILREYPRLTRDDIRAALEYAGALVADEDVFILPARSVA